jgi:hypothetical protein
VTSAPRGDAAPRGLSEAEAAQRLAARGALRRQRTSRSYASIVRANVFTVFNAILAGFGTVTLIFADWRDALFIGIIVVNSTIGITPEVRLVGGMCAVLAGAYAVVLLLPSTRSFFALSVPNAGMLATTCLAGATSIGALALCGFTVHVGSAQPAEPEHV